MRVEVGMETECTDRHRSFRCHRNLLCICSDTPWSCCDIRHRRDTDCDPTCSGQLTTTTTTTTTFFN